MTAEIFEYQCVETGDGSPTLSLAPTWEHMHALEGAFTETQYIYQPTVEKGFGAAENPVFLSLGLGVAYNEMLIAFEALRLKKRPGLIASYESVSGLRQAFTDWLQSNLTPLAPVYDQIMALYADKYGMPPEGAKSLLLEMFQSGKLQILGAAESQVPPVSHAILFDAFSSKTSPELWTTEFLESFFAKASASLCFVSTYACNGGLKRALKKNAFILDIQKGFGKKRHSIFAQKS